MSSATHEQGQLQLELYDLRREAKLRQAREWYFRNYFADTLEEGMRIAGPGTENGALVMMVWSYWEQACAYLNHGLLHEDLFFETSGEFYGVWDRVKPTIQQGRELFVEQAVPREHGKGGAALRIVDREALARSTLQPMQKMMKQMRTQLTSAAKA